MGRSRKPGGSPVNGARSLRSGMRPILSPSWIAGVDEAGRGSLAGPVVAAAVILPHGVVLPGLADSKLLAASTRLRLAEAIQAVATSWAVAAVEAADIDSTDILRATLRALAGG